jgi:predicted small metal-binding protein
MSKQISCGDLVTGCGFTATAATEAELLEKTAVHAHDSHGVKEIGPELAAKLKAAIKDR